MIYIKSVLVGAVVLLASTTVYLVVLLYLGSRRFRGQAAEVGLDLRAVVSSPSFWLIALLTFAVGFYWEFRRGSR